MSSIEPRELFALYHLGLDREGRHAFRNLIDVAKVYGTDAATVTQWLKQARIDPDTVATVDFNLSALHVDAMFLQRGKVQAFVETAWQGYLDALKEAVPGRFVHDVDYDDL